MIREELILQYLNNQLGSEEEKQVVDWAEQNPVDFQLMKEIWDHSAEAKDIKVFDVENEWNSFMANLEEEEISEETEIAQHASDEGQVEETVVIGEQAVEEAVVVPISRWKEWRPAMAAASMLFVVLMAYFLWPRTHEINHMAAVDRDEIVLPDDTKVVIEKGSSLKYLSSFEGQEKRVVKLEGIATFDITPNPDQPFVVETGLAGVRAIGTIFEVNASDSDVTGVKNIEGLIRFSDIEEEDKFKDVKEGESFTYDGSAFVETTPIEPKIRRFKAPPAPEPSYTIKEIINYLYRISNGSATTVGDNFDYDKRIKISLETRNVKKLIDQLDRTPNVVIDARAKDCKNCYEIRSFLKR